MKLIKFILIVCNWSIISFTQSDIFSLIERDSIYEKSLTTEIDPFSTILEFGVMEVNIKDSLSRFVQLREVLFRFDAKDLKSYDELSRLTENILENKLIFCYNINDRFDISFQNNEVDYVSYIKYKGYLMILYNYYISKHGDVGFNTGHKELDFFLEEPFDLIKIYLKEIGFEEIFSEETPNKNKKKKRKW